MHDRTFVIEEEQHRADKTADGGDDGGHTVAEFGAGDRDRGEDQEGERLPEFHGEGTCREEHTAALLTVGQRIRLGNIGDDRLRQNAEDCHGNAREDGDEVAPPQPLTAERRDEEHCRIGEETDNDDLFLAKFGCQTVDDGVERQTDDRHDDGQEERVALARVHQTGDIEGEPRLEERHGEEVDDVGIHEAAELLVFKRLEERREGFCFYGFGVNIVTLPDEEGGHQHGDRGDGGKNGDGEPDGVCRPEGRGEEPREIGEQVRDREPRDVGERDIGRDVDSVFLRVAELGNQRIVRCAVDCHEQIEQHQRDKQNDIIDDHVSGRREREDPDGNDGERNGDDLHEGDTPAALKTTGVRPPGNERIGDGVE